MEGLCMISTVLTLHGTQYSFTHALNKVDKI